MLLSPFHRQGREAWRSRVSCPRSRVEAEASFELVLNTKTSALHFDTTLPAKEREGKGPAAELLPGVDLPELPS